MLNMLAMMFQSKTSVINQPAYSDNSSILLHMSDALHQSIYRVLSLLIAILPGILAFFVALGILLVGNVYTGAIRVKTRNR